MLYQYLIGFYFVPNKQSIMSWTLSCGWHAGEKESFSKEFIFGFLLLKGGNV